MLPEVTYSAFGAYPRVALQSLGKEWPSFDCIIDCQNARDVFAISACHSLSAEELDCFGSSFRHRYECEFAAADAEYRFLCLNNATLVGDTGAIIDDRGELLLESLFPSFRANAVDIVRAHPSFSTCQEYKQFDEDVFVLFDGGGFKNYWHFHVDMLPAVLFAREVKLPTAIKFAMPKRREWHVSALKRLGVEETEIIELPNSFNKFRRVFLFSSIYWPELTVPNSIARKTFQSLKCGKHAQSIDNEERPRKFLYVARTDSTARRMTNEQDLIAGLQLLGFEIAVMSELAYEEQIALFQSSDVIVGPHGAGLTNAIYAEARALVVEIFPFGILNAPHYNFLCKALGLKYEMYVSFLRSDVSVHERWTLEVDRFLFRLICVLADYQIADRDIMIMKLRPTGNDLHSVVLTGEQPLTKLLTSNMITLYGFSGMEPWGAWVCERRGAVHFSSQLPESFILKMKVLVHIYALSENLIITCGESLHYVSSSSDVVNFQVKNPARHRTIWIDAPGAISPAKAANQPTGDTRLLSIGIASICIEEA